MAPLLFIAAATVLLYFSFVQNMKDSVGGTIVMLAGTPVFLWFAKKRKSQRG